MAGLKALVLGGHGFIGSHLAKRLKKEGFWVRTVDIHDYKYGNLSVDDYNIGDLRNLLVCESIFETPDGEPWDEVYQLAADMGGAGYCFSQLHDADIVHNSAMINLNIAKLASEKKVKNLFFSSSACTYPDYNQQDPENPKCSEDSVFPAHPDSPYGWEKIFSEILYDCFKRNYGLNVHIARYHNIFGPFGSWGNGKEKAPAAVVRKVALAKDGDEVEVWGSGNQTRSFLYIDECLDGMRYLMNSKTFFGPINIGSEEKISINGLVLMTADIAGKKIKIKNIPGPLGVMGRNSDNKLIREKLGWAPSRPLREGMEKTYRWIEQQINEGKTDPKE